VYPYTAFQSATSAPVNTVAPAVTGTTTVGQVLTSTPGTWTDNGGGTKTYQWQRDATGSGGYTNIGGATSSAYTLADADDGCHIKCAVTDTDSNGATEHDSNIVGLVVEPTATNSVAPTISGSAPQASTLTCNSNGTWAHMGGITTSFTYQWTRGGTNIAGATSSTYKTVNADVGQVVRVSVTAHNTGGASSATASSNSVTVTSAGFHSGTLTGYVPVVADIVVEWAVPAGGSSGGDAGAEVFAALILSGIYSIGRD
jgi:hypothetical protein